MVVLQWRLVVVADCQPVFSVDQKIVAEPRMLMIVHRCSEVATQSLQFVGNAKAPQSTVVQQHVHYVHDARSVQPVVIRVLLVASLNAAQKVGQPALVQLELRDEARVLEQPKGEHR